MIVSLLTRQMSYRWLLEFESEEITLKEKILELKKKENALILAHYYQKDEIQEIADYIGDSLELAKKARDTEAETIIFCGVKFMAETAKILSPNKRVIHPVPDAGCPMADMATGEELIEMKKQFPDAKVVCYVNSTAEVKAESDVCCTSSNAVDIVRSLPGNEVIFVPDKNLGAYVASQVPEKKIILWEGFCYVHGLLQSQTIEQVKQENPNAEVVAHPECSPEVLEKADFIGSTSKMLSYIKAHKEKTFIVLTESGIEYVLRRENPDKQFIFPDEALFCRNMKKNSLEDVLLALEGKKEEVTVDPVVAQKAFKALDAMFRE